jgi:hypothetical protein
MTRRLATLRPLDGARRRARFRSLLADALHRVVAPDKAEIYPVCFLFDLLALLVELLLLAVELFLLPKIYRSAYKDTPYGGCARPTGSGTLRSLAPGGGLTPFFPPPQ